MTIIVARSPESFVRAIGASESMNRIELLISENAVRSTSAVAAASAESGAGSAQALLDRGPAVGVFLELGRRVTLGVHEQTGNSSKACLRAADSR